MHEGFAGNLGEPKTSLGQNTGKDETGLTTSRRPRGDFPAVASESWKSTKVGRRNATNGVTPEKSGSRSCLIVPIETGRTIPSEPGSREGGGRVNETVVGKHE